MSLDDRKPQALLKIPFDEAGARFSPDGRWLAYQSNQSGAWEVYVQPFFPNGRRLQVSQGGGVRALWLSNGQALVFLKGLDVMRVPFSSASGDPGLPARLFSLKPDDLLLDVMRDGRLVVLRRSPAVPGASLNVVTNWFDHVRRSTAQ